MRPNTRQTKVKSVSSVSGDSKRIFPVSRRLSSIFAKKLPSSNTSSVSPHIKLKPSNSGKPDISALKTAEALLQKQEWESWCRYNGIFVGRNFEVSESDLMAFRRMFTSLKDKLSDAGVHYKVVAKSLMQYGILKCEEEALLFAKKICPRGKNTLTWGDILNARKNRDMHVRNRVTYYIKEVADRGMLVYKNTALHAIATSGKGRQATSTVSTTASLSSTLEDERQDVDSFRRPRTGNIRVSSLHGTDQKFGVIPIQNTQASYGRQNSEGSSRTSYTRNASLSIRQAWGRETSEEFSGRERDETSSHIREFMRQESGHTYRMNCGGRSKQGTVYVRRK